MNADITAGLVGHWEFDEGSDTTADINNDGIVNTLDWSIMNGEWGL